MHSTLRGVPASPGIVVGTAHLLKWEVPDVRHRIIADEEIEHELERFRKALLDAGDRLRSVRARAERRAGPEEAAIFDVQLTILEDPDLRNAVEGYIRQNLGAEKAFDLVMLEWRQNFARHTMPMMRERVGDLTDIQIRVLSLLLGLPDHDPVELPKGAGAILVTHDLTPSLTVQLDPDAISGIATDAGTRTSHVAILARSLGLPAVVGLRTATSRLKGGERVVLDGFTGMLSVKPTDAEVEAFLRRAELEAASEAELREQAGEVAITSDGTEVTIRANVDMPEEADQAATSGAEGVGLMRTEFLVVGRASMPDEEEQVRAYTRVVRAFGGRPVVIRTFDIGGDKLPIGGFPVEANPFLGWRAIRMCLDQPELFKTQLRALLRAGLEGDVRIMLPLIVTLEELRASRALLAEAAAELAERGVEHRSTLPLGVMIETPGAALLADAFAAEADFLSIGTNDLVQYTLAVDRGNVNLATRYTPLHPSVLRLIARVAEAGRAAGVEVSVCGEMASQPLSAFCLVGLGLRQLSVAPRSVPLVKRVVRGMSIAIAEEAARAALLATSPEAAELELRRRLLAVFGDAAFLRDDLGSTE
jgi:phosphotransferase system enzyme I (PtsI)